MTCPPNHTPTNFGVCIPNDPGGFTSKLYGIGLGIVAGAALLFMIYGGYMILTSRGDVAQFERGKGYVVYAVVGLVFAILSAVFLQVIVVDLLHIPGFSK